MASATEKKRKRGSKYSRHRKAGWKASDVADVEDALDERRECERLGFDKSDSFFTEDGATQVEKEPSQTISKSKRKLPAGTISTDSILDGVRLRCFATLEPQSAIPALPSQPKSRPAEIPERKLVKLVSNENIRQNKLKTRKVDPKSKFYDLWDVAGEASSSTKSSGKAQKSNIAKEAQNVELPYAGQSYNPTPQDHNLLLDQAYKKEQRKLRIAAKLERALKVDRSQIEFNSTGVDKVELAEDGDDNENENGTVKPVVVAPVKESKKRKRTQDQKERRARERVQRDAERRFEKDRARVSSQASRVDAIRKEIERAEREKARIKKEAAQHKRPKLPKLGPNRFEEDELAIKLVDELGKDADTASLRRLRPEGNLLRERFRSLQRRGVIEVRHRVLMRRKYTPKQFERKSTRNLTSQLLEAPKRGRE